ncbi:nuclear protein localization protein 4 homolog [Corticium candelabrum]|uniref:nuclear protein localization protein 4 homolog n=1 Tax=Corticium candelabrum TaxID=121492 RepID=UPI002E2F2E82|nr:nuclear protein localization protein 4 homolog [Corticium candelabrum]
MIIRIQSREGTKRIDVLPSETCRTLWMKIAEEFGLNVNHSNWSVCRDRNSTVLFPCTKKPLSSAGLRHGDMVFIALPEQRAMDTSSSSTDAEAGSVQGVKEDEVDVLLSKESGRIERERDAQLCRHGPQGKCVHCLPVDPFDEEYLKSRDPPIKYLSFHSYLRKQQSGVDKGKYAFLESVSSTGKMRTNKSGDTWQELPSTITLKRQEYRHVDNIMFEDPGLVDRFIDYWRHGGKQRLGFLYGRYEVHRDVPLGIKAVVAAIYEPPQDTTASSIVLLEDEQAEIVNEVASHLGLHRIGWIFTDLEALPGQQGKVMFKRHGDTYFLTAEECIMAADFQLQHPNACRHVASGIFGSKFVTVVITGNSDEQISFEGYQVTNQAMTLVQENYLVPTIDAPELGYIRESDEGQYVPDVIYKEKEAYKVARPLPVEYLIVDMPAAFPQDPRPMFQCGVGKPFPVENRTDIGQLQNFDEFAQYLSHQPKDHFVSTITDFHLILYLSTAPSVDVIRPYVKELCEAICNHDDPVIYQWNERDAWKTVECLVEQFSMTGRGPPIITPPPQLQAWSCHRCTYMNRGNETICQICDSPRQG